MKNIEGIKVIINSHKRNLKKRFKVKSISLFGSYLRNEENEKIDIDLLVEFSTTIDLFEFIRLENFLSQLLGRKVDMVMKDTLKPRIKDRILKEAIAI
ncbi:MAG: nucleotidyltransferase family protein [Candidatus Cloacimonetes bacterium]|nr:nucleotidyltransferase family protein [Candidatus Cloacimonadota bacterium]